MVSSFSQAKTSKVDSAEVNAASSKMAFRAEVVNCTKVLQVALNQTGFAYV